MKTFGCFGYQEVFNEHELVVNEDIFDEEEKKQIFKNRAIERFIDAAIKSGHIKVVCDRVGNIFPRETKPSNNPKDFFVEITANFNNQ
jgi:hypothetical protein